MCAYLVNIVIVRQIIQNNQIDALKMRERITMIKMQNWEEIFIYLIQ